MCCLIMTGCYYCNTDGEKNKHEMLKKILNKKKMNKMG